MVLKITSRNELNLNDVLRKLDICKNLVSGSLLNKNGFKLVFESNNFVLTKSEVFVGKGYMRDGLFKMTEMTIIPTINNNKNTCFAYMLELSNV